MTDPIRPLRDLLQRPYGVVFMDCDGIIFDTNQSKCEAFRDALAPYPRAAVDALVAHHMASGGISRYVKFNHFFAELHPVSAPEVAIQNALALFSAYSERAYAALRPRPESLRFAAHFGGAARVHVISGSDGDELRRVFEQQGIAPAFGSVCGSPETKVNHITRILKSAGLRAKDALFIGDGGGDWDAARELGIPFIYLAEMSEWATAKETIIADCAKNERAHKAPIAFADSWREIEEALG